MLILQLYLEELDMILPLVHQAMIFLRVLLAQIHPPILLLPQWEHKQRQGRE